MTATASIDLSDSALKRLDSDPYQVADLLNQSGEDGGQLSPVRLSGTGTAILSNYNPMTRTYFKCSIYSPSNRLYTVDEVNSNFSGDPMSSSKFVHSGFRISGNNPI